MRPSGKELFRGDFRAVRHKTAMFFDDTHILGSTVVPPYVGMARKQNGGYNASISVQTLIFMPRAELRRYTVIVLSVSQSVCLLQVFLVAR